MLKKTQKLKPLKKIPETNAIFENLHQVNQESNQNSKSLIISIDSKAKVKIGNLSRNGKSRNLVENVADDHDHVWSAILVPFGILNLETNKLSIYSGSSAETSNFIVDCLSQWWEEHKDHYAHHEELVIDHDGGSATRSDRTQFIKRIIELAHENRTEDSFDLLSSLSQQIQRH